MTLTTFSSFESVGNSSFIPRHVFHLGNQIPTVKTIRTHMMLLNDSSLQTCAGLVCTTYKPFTTRFVCMHKETKARTSNFSLRGNR